MNHLIVNLLNIVSQTSSDSISIVTDSITVLKSSDSDAIAELRKAIDDSNFRSSNYWMIFATALVFLMNLGFACFETGLIRSKNAANILFKNTLVPIIAVLTFSGWGFSIMYPGECLSSEFLGFGSCGIYSAADAESLYVNGNYTFWTFFLFQAMLASLAATIISGAVAERINFISYIIFCFFFAGLIYPIIGMWHWGGGWLSTLTPQFHDFAGASIIHTVGGYGALVGAAMLGPRIGKYMDGRVMPIMGHNIPIAVIGMFILWFGWIGLNGGAIMAASPEKLSFVLANTFISAASGGLGAFLISYFINKTHDITMSMNGILAGLVAISASADIVSPLESFFIGLIAGLFVVFSVLIFDKLKIDDPVGAISVHLMCGTWGTLAVGIFGPLANKEQFITQIIGCAAIGTTVCILSFILFFILKKTRGIRVTPKEELEGLDLTSHGMKAYTLDIENN